MGSQSRLVDGTYSVVSTYLLQITNYKLYKITNMNINKLFLWSLITIVSTTVDGRVFGKPWGWATASGLKPNSLNTIVLNDCVGRPSVFFHHRHSNTQGEQIAKMVGKVSTSVTSRAIMDIITRANGHSPVSSCSQSELVEMEGQYESCIKRVQYKLKCFHLSKDRQCDMITEFLEECTRGILGLCFGSPFSSYIYHVQNWSLSTSLVSRRAGLLETCFADQKRNDVPNISYFPTEAPPVMDRVKLLRRYLRHPTLANSSN